MQNITNEDLRNQLEHSYANFKNVLNPGNHPMDGVSCQILQSELLHRGIERLIESNKNMIVAQNRNRKETRKFSRISFGLTILMIILAGVTIFYALSDSTFDRKWMKKQEVLLAKIDMSITAIPNNIIQVKADTIKKLGVKK